MDKDKITALARAVKESRGIVFFGGAGVSTESGLKDYRSADGIYNTVHSYGVPPEEILSHDFFFEHTEIFYDFYREFFLAEAAPNSAHLALAELEREGRLTAVITQNVDCLHQAAGSRRVIELHGSAAKYRCVSCGKAFDLQYFKASGERVPKCSRCGAIIKPCVTLYGEMLDEMVINEAVGAISEADMLIVGGTSLTVYPAASFVRYFKGDCLAVINKDKTAVDSTADIALHDSIGKVLSEVMKLI